MRLGLEIESSKFKCEHFGAREQDKIWQMVILNWVTVDIDLRYISVGDFHCHLTL